MDYVIYVVDTETTGLERKHDVIECSFYRLSDDTQKTWFLKPFDVSTADAAALKINGHKLEDISHQTSYGKETYKDPKSTLIEIENWILDDGFKSEKRILCGQNIAFDKEHLLNTWEKAGSRETFPFGRRLIDTMSIEFVMDLAKGQMAEGYSLKNLTKKYGIKNEKAHTAEADTKATKEVFLKQIEYLKSIIK